MSRLLNESWLEGLPDNIVSNLEALNNYVVQRICERIKKIGDIGAADANRLKTAIEYAGADLKAIEKEVARIMGTNQQEVERLFEEVAEENVEFSNTYYRAKNMDTLQSYTSRSALSSFVEAAMRQAMDGTSNISNTYMVGFKRGKQTVPLREYYISTIDRAITYVQTGVVDYQSAMRSTVKEMARSGLRRVTWESGYSRRLDSSASQQSNDGGDRTRVWSRWCGNFRPRPLRPRPPPHPGTAVLQRRVGEHQPQPRPPFGDAELPALRNTYRFGGVQASL